MTKILSKTFLACLKVFFLLGFLLFFSPATPTFAQNENPAYGTSKKKEAKIRKKDIKNSRSLGQKVKKTSKQDIGDKASVQSNYSGKEPDIDIKSKRAEKNKNTSDYSGNVKYQDFKKLRGQKDKKTANYQGKIPLKSVELQKKDAKYNAQEQADYSGRIPFVNYKKKREQKAKDLSAYSGAIKINRAGNKRKMRDKAQDLADYSGSVKYINYPKLRQQKAQSMANFKGAVKVRVRQKPKGSITSDYKGAPNKNRFAANYNKKRFKSGKMVKKSELPNYQKIKPKKVRYDSRETKMWTEGGNKMPTRGERKLPKTSKKAKREADREAQKLLQPEEPKKDN